MGFENVRVYDPDTVAPENIGVQFFRYTDIGKSKVEAVAEIVHDFAGVNIEAINRKIQEDDQPIGIVITAVDTMEARKFIWSLCKGKFQVRLVIDPRMSIESAAVYTVLPMDTDHCQEYEATLFGEDEAVQDRCTLKSTMYTPLLISGHICKVVKDFLINENQDHVSCCLWDIKNNQQDCCMKIKGPTNPLMRVQPETPEPLPEVG